MKEHIALIYVPNQYCNFGCKYCYLGSLTDNKDTHTDITTKLEQAVQEIEKAGYGISRFQLHGAEVSTIPEKYLSEMFEYMTNKLSENSLERNVATAGSVRMANIHIKTNLHNFAKLQALYSKHKVTVSGSFDLPFSLHAKYRVDKQGNSTLEKTLKNISLLKDYKYGKGLSCVITKAHLEKIDEVVKDLRYMHEVIGFNMIENFYFMFGYDSKASEDKFQEKIEGTEMLSQDEMVEFYQKIKQEFIGTPYEQAIKYGWFKEFQSGYCTDVKNCGTTQLILQKNGDVYPCHRTQPDPEYKYGNIFKDGFSKIKENATKVIEKNESTLEISDDCFTCPYFKYCQQGCSLVRKETGLNRSYTCGVQRALYRDNPRRYPMMETKEIEEYVKDFVLSNNPKYIKKFTEVYPKRDHHIITPELYSEEQKLQSIIDNDEKLKVIYESGIFKIIVNGEVYPLEPQEFSFQTIYGIKSSDEIKLEMDKKYFLANCEEDSLSGNELKISMLRNTATTYGEEKRTKQEHLWEEGIYYNQILEMSESVDGDKIILDISDIIHRHKDSYLDGVFNSIFFTTKQARIYHYEKHAKNAFYHIQAINIPFHNLKFVYMKDDK